MRNVFRRSTGGTALAAIVAAAMSVMPPAPASAVGTPDGGTLDIRLSDISTGQKFDLIDQPEINGFYDTTVDAEVFGFLVNLRVIGFGDPFLQYTLSATNTGAEPATLTYGFNIDVVPLVPGDPNWRMRSTLEYGVEDTGGDGSAALVPNAFVGLQQAVLSDDRTNVVSDPILFLGFDELTEPGQAPPSDSGLLPLLAVPPLPPGVTIDAYGVIGLRGSFELSPGDTAVITGRFDIVPEPGSLVFAGIAMALYGLRRGAVFRCVA
jgi:hypothetical protein